MTLVLEIEYLSGVAFAAAAPDAGAPDWPPQPDRVFSALVASWAARGGRREEAEALAWLEGLSPPRLQASRAWARTDHVSYVPANDPRTDRQKHALHVLPQLRNRQPRRFPAARPEEPTIRLFWEGADASDGVLAALQAVAADTAYVGHSASLTRCRFARWEAGDLPADAEPVSRSVYPGRLQELQLAFAAGRRPSPGAWVRRPEPAPPAAARSVFATRWLVLEAVEGSEMPDVRGGALASKAIRDRIVAGYRELGLQAPELVSGYAPDGRPSRAPHLAVVPLPFVGFPHADGHLLGFGLVPPRDGSLLEDADFRRVLRYLAPRRPSDERRVFRLVLGGLTLELALTFEPSRASLRPDLYVRGHGQPARTFATVTPIALDRHPKERDAAHQEEVARLVAEACRHVGLPVPEAALEGAVVVDKHSALEGVPPARPSGNSPPWLGWRLPPSLAGRPLTHAVIRFPEAVEGPVILGAGRFLGLGLCRPLPEPEGRP
jgi:CRISPR-associated protein Csb2